MSGFFFGRCRRSTGSHNSSQAARTQAGFIFTEDVDVEDINLVYNGREICCDEDWDGILKSLKAGREADKNARAAIRVFQVDVEKTCKYYLV